MISPGMYISDLSGLQSRASSWNSESRTGLESKQEAVGCKSEASQAKRGALRVWRWVIGEEEMGEHEAWGQD